VHLGNHWGRHCEALINSLGNAVICEVAHCYDGDAQAKMWHCAYFEDIDTDDWGLYAGTSNT
jgi:hypothetical protein